MLVTIIEDQILEGDESFRIEMTSDIEQVSIQNDNATVTILDDDSELSYSNLSALATSHFLSDMFGVEC